MLEFVNKMNFRFAAERTLGKLAKWLRLLGFDTMFENESDPGQFLDDLLPGTILLTRTEQVRDTLSASQRLIFIESDDTEKQLRQVIDELGLEMKDIRPFSRCLICNVVNEKIEKDRIYGKVPDYVWENNTVFQSCPECKKIYWPGSHIERSLEKISNIFN
jgi:uncharacterized protein with PIN domain